MFKLYPVPRVSHLTAPWSERGEGALRTRLVQAQYESYIVTKKRECSYMGELLSVYRWA